MRPRVGDTRARAQLAAQGASGYCLLDTNVRTRGELALKQAREAAFTLASQNLGRHEFGT